MGLGRFNSEGYYDPTPYEAAKLIQEQERSKYRPLVYICSPYAGDVAANTIAARRYCRFAVDMGYIPLASHLLYPQFLDDSNTAQRELGLKFGLILLSHCQQIWVFGTHVSEGMAAEIKKAKRKNIHIRYFSEDMKEVSHA